MWQSHKSQIYNKCHRAVTYVVVTVTLLYDTEKVIGGFRTDDVI